MRTPISFAIAIIFINIVEQTQVQSHDCVLEPNQAMEKQFQNFYDQFEATKSSRQPFDQNKENILSQSKLCPIRVTTDTTDLQIGDITNEKRIYLISLVNIIIQFMESFIKIIPNKGNNIFIGENNKACFDKEVPTGGIPLSDLHLYLSYINDRTSKSVISATACTLQQLTFGYRVNFGTVQFNIATMNFDDNDHYAHHLNLKNVLHEFIHILGFNQRFFEHFINPETKENYPQGTVTSQEYIRGFSTMILKTPMVSNTARKYFNCDTLSGMQLENQGGKEVKNSNWERTILQNELMTGSQLAEGGVLSIFTTSLLQDTGFWDEINENLTDPIYWGKDKGCNFPIEACQSKQQFEEFSIKSDSYSCGFRNNNIGTSSLQDDLSDNCRYLKTPSFYACGNPLNNKLNPQFSFGYNSKCYASNIYSIDYPKNVKHEARCHHYLCSPDNKSMKIIFQLDNSSVECRYDEAGHAQNIYEKSKIIDAYEYLGYIRCPNNYSEFCEDKNCKNHCSSNGMCIRGHCLCKQGYSDEDCSQKCGVYSENVKCVDACTKGNHANPDNTCKATCPKGYYPNNGVCSLCDFSCSQCTGPLKTNCTACQFLTLLSGTECVKTCPYGQYADQKRKICLKCPSGCLDCESATVCKLCVSDKSHYLEGTSCVPCNSPCSTCLKGKLSHCLSCENYYIFQNGTCTYQCRDGYRKSYIDECIPDKSRACTARYDTYRCNKFYADQGLKPYLLDKVKYWITATACFPPCTICRTPFNPSICS